MWVLMLDTYVGGIGTFPKGHKLDLSPDIIEHLPKDCFKKCPAPWDAQKDTKAIKQARLEGNARDAQAWAEILQDKAEQLKQKADSLVAPVGEKQAEAKKAEQLAKQEIARAEKASKNTDKAPSEQNTKLATDLKRNAWQLARESEKRDAEFQLAHAELTGYLARAELKRLKAEDAKRQAETAAKVITNLKEKAETQAKAKANAEAKAKAKAEAEAKAKAETEAKAKAEAEAESKVRADRAAAETKAKIDANLKSTFGVGSQKDTTDAKPETEQPADAIDESGVKPIDESVGEQSDGVAEGQAVST